jgi:hypothetical protein
MPVPWDDPIKATKQLSIFPTSKVTSGPWAKAFTNALAEFNKLSNKHSLGVTFVLVKNAPDPSGVGGADVQFDTINGKANFTCFNKPFSFTLAGTALLGHTSTISQVFGSKERVAKAFIHVPATPSFGGRTGRVLGDPGKLVMAAHELIHACGLDEKKDHSSLSNAEIFFSPMQAIQGATPSDDRMTPFGLSAPVMPPLVLAAPTIKLIQTNWS